jgi:DNA-binding CsgD family transcriptional regulator
MSFLSWVQKMQAASSLQGLDRLLHQYLDAQGITGYTFSYFGPVRTSKKNHLQHEVVSERMRSWHDYYHEKNYEATDATLDHLQHRLLPFYWNVGDQLAESKTEKERIMRQESLDFGVTEGVSIPLRGSEGHYAELTLRQFKGEVCLRDWQERQAEWYFVVLTYFDGLQKLLINEQLLAKGLLTRREMQCLHCLADHYSLQGMATFLNMTERTVNFHIQNLNRKLKSRNKYEAVSKAKALGLLSPTR